VLPGDQKLVERCLEGDDAAWERIVTMYAKRIYNLSYRYTGSREDAEDLTQEIMIRVYQNLNTFRSDAGSFQNWILRVGRNLIIDHYRQTRRYQPAAGSEEMDGMHLEDDKLPNPQQMVEMDEAARFLWNGLNSLSPELKEALVLRDLEGLAYREIAEMLGIPEGTVKSRINRGRVELARILSKRRAQKGMTI
jgi:RNA polymerase sigma-70 factor (ECF subfamily)